MRVRPFPTRLTLTLTAALALVTGLLIGPPAHANPWEGIRAWETARVMRVVDGDTLIVRDAVTNERSRIRLIGINAPEVDTPLSAGWCGGWQATEALKEMLPPGTIVRLLAADQSSQGRNRPLRVVLAQNRTNGEFDIDVGWAMAERGWGHWFTQRQEANMSSLYRAVIEGAQQRREGIWNPNLCGELEQPEANIELRVARTPTPRSLNNEWVVVRNVGDTDVDLSGWTLRHAGNQAWYTMPGGSLLAPGDYRVVRTGSGTPGSPTGHDVYRGHTARLFLPPGREPNLVGNGAYLLDRFGNYRFWREYPCTERCPGDPIANAIVVQDLSIGQGKGKRRINSQFVRLANQGSSTICLDAYQVRSSALTYTIPPGTCLVPGQTWTLHGGRNGANGDSVYLRRKSPMFYLRDTMRLVNDRDQVIIERQW